MVEVEVHEMRSLYDEHGDALLSYFARRVGRDLAEDLLAETFRAAIESRASFDGRLGSRKGWLFGIGTNLLRRHWRSEKRRLLALERSAYESDVLVDPLLGDADRIATRLDAQGDARRLLTAVTELSPEDRDLLILSGWEHLSSTEIGEALGIGAGAVRTRLHRLRGRAATRPRHAYQRHAQRSDVMNQLSEFNRLRPANEHLDDAARERIWASVIGTPLATSDDHVVVAPSMVEDESWAARASEAAPDRTRRRRVALLGAAAVAVVGLGGLIAVQSTRDTSSEVGQQPVQTVARLDSSSPATMDGAARPAWHQTLRPLIPEPFDYLALTSATNTAASFVAIDSTSGKSLELRVTTAPAPNVGSDQTSDASGTWTATPQGWQLVTPAGLSAEVSCNIGAQGRDFPGPPNYCDMASTGPVTGDELRAITAAVANPQLLDTALADTSQRPTVPTEGVTDIIAAALPTQDLIGDTTWTDTDHVWDFAAGTDRPDTSVRVVTGVPQPPTETTGAAFGLYDDAAAFWIVDPSGIALRISTTDPTPESLEPLAELAERIMQHVAAAAQATRQLDEVATTYVVDEAPVAAAGPLDYATTTDALPLWPGTNASDPPAATTAYGMQLCDGGAGTKIVRVDPDAGPAHSYSGTLCVFINLAEARPDAVTSCATTTGGFNYARCQRRIDQTDTAGAGTANSAVASTQQQVAMAAFPAATAAQQPEEFTPNVGAAADADSSVDFSDDAVSVTLTSAESDDAAADTVDLPGVCLHADLPGATVDGCAGRYLLATGLAYGAFQDGDGPIEIIGVVPDEVTAIDINGTTLNPSNNVWHYTATPGAPLIITVRSADGRTASTN